MCYIRINCVKSTVLTSELLFTNELSSMIWTEYKKTKQIKSKKNANSHHECIISSYRYSIEIIYCNALTKDKKTENT